MDRHLAMVSMLAERPALTVEEAMAMFSASSATIRRDFAGLVRRGVVARGPNEIRRLTVDAGVDKPMALREVTHRAEKDAIAKQAAQLVREDEVIFIDGGTTTQSMIKFLPRIRLRIITSCIRIATLLLERNQREQLYETILPGGLLSTPSQVLYGPQTCRQIESYRAAWAFIGVDGMDEANLYSVNEFIASTQMAMIANSQRTVLLADHSKMGRRSMVCTARLDRRFKVITDAYPANAQMLRRLAGGGAEILEIPVG